ncbi:ABC transporter permease [uncultured Phascolarctobacterium sp.]|uniref:ABC transporter permease n=1 Tax=uncultured Phascolarctobacterium sp. TaxID=512296 RepID=UPI0025F6C427|nr:ABC transporter permease [uncultured Phascolarctobacterium sp.]
MLAYALKRIFMAVPVLVGISLLSFILGVLSPGDPAEFALNQNGLDAPTEEQIAAMRAELGLDRPAYVQYAAWMLQVLRGDFGSSYINGKDILQELLLRLPVTMELAALALLLAAAVGISLGLVCAVYRGSWLDNAVQFLTNIMLAVPGFWLALLMILLFGEILRLLPTSGGDSLQSFILPALAVAFSTMATVCRFMRSSLLKEFGQQYFIIAKARGISSVNLLLKYALPNAILPVIALLGNYLASVMGGSVIAESIFALPGISSMALEAIRYRDYPVLQAYVLLTGWLLVLITLGVDLLMFYLNPKIKTGA